MEKHEGKLLKNYLKGRGLEMNEIADKLKQSRQNVNYHLRKAVLEDDFKRLVPVFIIVNNKCLKKSHSLTIAHAVNWPYSRKIGKQYARIQKFFGASIIASMNQDKSLN